MDLVADFRAIVNGDPTKEMGQYCPYKGVPREIPVLVNRNPIESDSIGGSTVPVTRFEVSVIRSDVDGVESPQEGFDTLEIKKRLSDMNRTTFKVTGVVIEDDPGRFDLQVTA